jgi:hypothetical protein
MMVFGLWLQWSHIRHELMMQLDRHIWHLDLY